MLPKVNAPRYNLQLPSNGKTIQYRPFTHGEEHALAMVGDTDGVEAIMSTIGAIIEACTFDAVKFDELAGVDVDYLFLNLRIKSVGETSVIGLKCSKCNKTIETEIDLTTAKVDGEFTKKTKADIGNGLGVVLRMPTVGELMAPRFKDVFLQSIYSVIESVYDDNDVYPFQGESDEEVIEFIKSLSTKQVTAITEKVETYPRVVIRHKTKCLSCNDEQEHVIEGLESFF